MVDGSRSFFTRRQIAALYLGKTFGFTRHWRDPEESIEPWSPIVDIIGAYYFSIEYCYSSKYYFIT